MNIYISNKTLTVSSVKYMIANMNITHLGILVVENGSELVHSAQESMFL